jgi:hypothetical protein
MTFSSKGQTNSLVDPSKSSFDPLYNGFGYVELDWNPLYNGSIGDFHESKIKIFVLQLVKTTDFIKKIIPILVTERVKRRFLRVEKQNFRPPTRENDRF